MVLDASCISWRQVNECRVKSAYSHNRFHYSVLIHFDWHDIHSRANLQPISLPTGIAAVQVLLSKRELRLCP